MTSAKFFKFNYMIALYMIDCLASSEQYFSQIQDENKFTNKTSERGPWDGSTWATTFDCYVG